jgi:hypothetical protein
MHHQLSLLASTILLVASSVAAQYKYSMTTVYTGPNCSGTPIKWVYFHDEECRPSSCERGRSISWKDECSSSKVPMAELEKAVADTYGGAPVKMSVSSEYDEECTSEDLGKCFDKKCVNTLDRPTYASAAPEAWNSNGTENVKWIEYESKCNFGSYRFQKRRANEGSASEILSKSTEL